jgi:hypothetical protein
MTDLRDRDRARDEADIRQRLSDLAATITTDTTWDQLQTLFATSPPPRSHRRTRTLGRVRFAAAAVVIVLAAGALLAVRGADDGRVTTATTTSTTTRPRDTTTTTTTLPGSTLPAPPVAPNGAEVAPSPPDGIGAVGGQPTPTTRSAAPTTSPTTARPAATTPVGPIPAGASPDGHPVALTYGGGDFNPTITYHQEGGNAVIDVWNNQGAAGVQHLDTLVVPPRGNQNCLILGSTSAPFPNLFAPQRIIGGVVTTQAVEVSAYGTSSTGIAYISHDAVAPGLHAVLVLLDDDAFTATASYPRGIVQHTVSDTDRDAYPDTC